MHINKTEATIIRKRPVADNAAINGIQSTCSYVAFTVEFLNEGLEVNDAAVPSL